MILLYMVNGQVAFEYARYDSEDGCRAVAIARGQEIKRLNGFGGILHGACIPLPMLTPTAYELHP